MHFITCLWDYKKNICLIYGVSIGDFLISDKEERAAPIFRKPGCPCGILSVATNIVLELK